MTVRPEPAVLHGIRASHEIVFAKGLRHRLWDRDGKEYLDAVSGTMGPAMVGHSHPAVVDAVSRQMATLASTFYIFDNTPAVEFAHLVGRLAPGRLSRTLLCPGGGEAVEAAVKFAMRVTGKTEFLSLAGSYHGMSLATMGLSGLPELRKWIPGALRWPTFRQIPSPHFFRTELATDEEEASAAAAAALVAAINEESYGQVAALIMEVVQGPGGHVMFPASYYQAVQRTCREADVLLIVDEVQTGLGRCGTVWACDLFDIQPDMLIIGKAFGGGVPFGGLIVRDDLVSDDVEESGWHYLTFMNQPLQAAAGLAVIGVVEEEGLVERARYLGGLARRYLEECRERHEVITEVRGPGLFLAVQLGGGRPSQATNEACRAAFEYGLQRGLVTWLGAPGNILKFKPPLIVSEDELYEMLELFEETVGFAERRMAGVSSPT